MSCGRNNGCGGNSGSPFGLGGGGSCSWLFILLLISCFSSGGFGNPFGLGGGQSNQGCNCRCGRELCD